jgi:hypothetical protein
MTPRRHLQTNPFLLSAIGWSLLGLALGLNCAKGQTVTTLVQFTNSWSFDQSGRDLTTTLWKTNTYVEDAFWTPSSRGLLGLEPDTPAAYAQHAPINTPLAISSTVTSYYFRTTFLFSGSTNGLSLMGSNLVDDGCVIYLNGREVARHRVPANQNATTLAQGAFAEGQLDVMTITNVSLLRQGNNLIAVEVHQSSANSADIMWGMKLLTLRATPLTITNQPQSQLAVIDGQVTFTVGVSGGPAFYQWQKNGVNITGATGSSYTIPNVQLSHSGSYGVVVTNAVSTVTTSNAVLTVYQDLTGPKLVSAVVQETGATNQIFVQFSEILFSGFLPNSPTTNLLNYRLTPCGSSDEVDILQVVQSGTRIRLTVAGAHWVIGGCYYLTVNNITDASTNRIAPDSQIGVSWLHSTPVMDSTQRWRFHDSAFFEPGVADTNWFASDFVESFWWVDGTSCFYFGQSGATLCNGTAVTPVAYQPEPTLFRTWFDWPTNLPTANTTLRPRFAADDGAVFYLNGVEIYRHNMPEGALNSNSKASTIVATAFCVTNLSWPVTNLLAGSNCFAAAVFQANNAIDADTAFCFELNASYLQTPLIASQPEPTLAISPVNMDAVRLWWTGGGYALESTTNLTDNSASYPVGPWQEVPRMSNPYTNFLEEPQRFFRLKK